MEFSHFNKEGHGKMVDVTYKPNTFRTAVAAGTVTMAEKTLEKIIKGQFSKGDVLAVAQIGGINGVKQTSNLIPMCHNIFVSGCDISFEINREKSCIEITAEAVTEGKTGVEMEAMTGVATAALTIYDMCKSVDKDIVISKIYLVEKTGGQSGSYERKK
jgi:cyclic pyranopterin phosphate synthase